MMECMARLLLTLYLLTYSILAAADALDDRIQALLGEKIGDTRLNFEITFAPDAIEELRAAQGDIQELKIDSYSTANGNFKLRATINNGQQEKHRALIGRFTTYYQVPVSARILRPGEIISPQDIVWVQSRSAPSREVILDGEALLGMQLQVALNEKRPFFQWQLKKPDIMKEGQPVTIMYQSGNITLQTLGVALAAGGMGDSIRVKNEKTGIIVFGRIVNKNLVVVGSGE